MARRITASVMVGREGELALLREALTQARAGTARTVLIGGESGVGKSRLVAELVADARRAGWSIHQGGCPPATGGSPVPFAPFTAVLRSIVRSVDARLLDHLVGPGRRELAALLPELGEPDTDWVAGGGAARLFEAVLSLVERVTRRGHGMVVVLEDLHWADASARALLAWLVQELGPAPVLLVGTYRTDTDPGDPLPSLLVELDRIESYERMELAPLAPDLAAQLVAALAGDTLDGTARAGIVRRAGGIPLYLEELVSSRSMPDGPPDSVRVAVARRASALDVDAARVAQLVAVAGRPVAPVAVGAISGLTGDALDRAVASGIASGLLGAAEEPGHEEVGVRHALVGEAIVSALPHGAAARMHAAWAGLLLRRPELGPMSPVERTAVIAGHLLAAGDRDAAVVALIAAADAATDARAFPAADAGYERAIGLAGDRLGSLVADPIAVLDAAAQAAWLAGVPARAVTRGARATEQATDVAGSPVAVRRQIRQAAYLAAAGSGERAIAELSAVVAASGSGRLRARALLDLGRALTVAGDVAAAVERCAEALTEARAWNDHRTAAQAGVALGVALSAASRHAEAIDALTEARRQEEAGPSAWSASGRGLSRLPEALARDMDEAALLLHIGDVPGSLAAALHAHQVAVDRGLAEGFRSITAAAAAWDLLRLGRWREADEMLASSRPAEGAGGATAGAWTVVAAWLAAARGGWSDSERLLGTVDPGMIDAAPGLAWAAIGAAAEAMTAAGQGRLLEARAAVRAGLRGLDTRAAPSTVAALAVVGLGVEADATTAARSRADVGSVRDARDAALELAARARSVLSVALTPDQSTATIAGMAPSAPAIAGPTGPGAWREALLARVDAELARISGQGELAAWARVISATDAAADPYAAATARLRLAAVLLAAPLDRPRATDALAAAWTAAQELGAAPLVTAIERLARRARLSVGTATAGAPGAPGPRAAALAMGLSDREVDVLELLALGRTDREIAAQLFITEKTAGHHVSHILAKLSVTRRGEAAAVAHRLGLVAPGAAGDEA